MSERGERGPDPHRAEPEHLDDPEDAGEHVVWDGPLDDGQARDVGERVSEAEQAEQDDRDGGFRPEPDHDEGQTPAATSPDRKAGLSRRAPASESATSVPIRAPTPDARSSGTRRLRLRGRVTRVPGRR